MADKSKKKSGRQNYDWAVIMVDYVTDPKSLLIYPHVVRGAKYNSTAHTWTFPSGAKIIFGSMHHRQDRLNYQGKAYDFI